MRGFEDIGSKGHFSAKRGVFGSKTALAATTKGVTKKISGQNNIKNEFSTMKLLRVQIFSKIWQLLKNHYHRGIFNILGGKKPPPGGKQEFSSTQHRNQIIKSNNN